ncbi:MAG: methylated-DNA-protein-cysteine methyltransferase related protein, partial [Marinobacter sp. T13-3]
FVGRALGRLPAGHSIPWHRVIRSNGQIAFPEGTEARQLQTEKLRMEGVEVIKGRVRMKAFQWQP